MVIQFFLNKMNITSKGHYSYIRIMLLLVEYNNILKEKVKHPSLFRYNLLRAAREAFELL